MMKEMTVQARWFSPTPGARMMNEATGVDLSTPAAGGPGAMRRNRQQSPASARAKEDAQQKAQQDAQKGTGHREPKVRPGAQAAPTAKGQARGEGSSSGSATADRGQLDHTQQPDRYRS